MSDVPWLTLIGVAPLLGVVATGLTPKDRPDLAKLVALVSSLVAFALSIGMIAAFDADDAGFQLVERHDWITQYGVSYHVGVDGVALVLVALTTFLLPIVLLASWNQTTRVRSYFGLMLALETAMIGVFVSLDLFLFYVFWEAMLVPMYFLIGSYGGERRVYAAVKFFLYTLLAGLLMLTAVLGLYFLSGDLEGGRTFDYQQLLDLSIAQGTQRWLFLGFFIAFAVKVPIFPFHTWLPDAHTEAPTGGSVILAGVMLKMGTFGFLRYAIPLFPDAADYFAPTLMVLGTIGVVYGALVAMVQKDIKRLVAYTSIAHLGFIVLGTFAFTTQGQAGGVLYMVNHGISTGALFLIIGFLYERRHSRQISDFGGVAKVTPVLAGSFLVAGLSSLALPGLNGFVSEFLVLAGTFTRHRVLAIIATTGIVLAALYILLAYQRTMQGPVTDEETGRMTDLTLREKVVIAPMLVAIVALGVFPKPVLDRITPSVERILDRVGQEDPEPTAGTTGVTADFGADASSEEGTP
jgi:NADH-quinone oxidoreductase subunit M